MTRKDWHDALDEVLDNMGFTDGSMKWGSASVEVKFEKGHAVIKIKERETEKSIRSEQHG